MLKMSITLINIYILINAMMIDWRKIFNYKSGVSALACLWLFLLTYSQWGHKGSFFTLS